MTDSDDNLDFFPDGDEPRSMVVVRIGDKAYPARTSETCRTCQHPQRARIEAWYLTGYRWKAILREIGDEESALGPLTEKSLRNHAAKHLPIEATTQASIIERRAAQIGDALEEYGDRIADGAAALDMIIANGFNRVSAGEIKVETPDLLAAIRLKHQIDQSVGDGLDTESWRLALMAHMQIALKYIPFAERTAFGRELSENPILRALAEAQSKPRELTT